MANPDDKIDMPSKERPHYKTWTGDEGPVTVIKGKPEAKKTESPKTLKDFGETLKKMIKD